jgi:hypothetical protein
VYLTPLIRHTFRHTFAKSWVFEQYTDVEVIDDALSITQGRRQLYTYSQAWLTDILGRIADHKINRFDEQLP